MPASSAEEYWPICTRQQSLKCELEVNPKRWALGLHWCLECASPPNSYCAVPMHKSNSILITNKEQLKYVAVQTPRDGQE